MIDWTQRWLHTWTQLGLTAPGPAVLAELLACYGEPHRHYHTLRHLEECFAGFDALADLAMRPGEIELALWYHDAVYDPRRQDNEARSARMALDQLRLAGACMTRTDRVSAQIMATRRHEPGGDPDCAILLDADLGILGAPWPRFAEYEEQVRSEYTHVPDELFHEGRARVLRALCGRGRIYATARGAHAHEAQARANLARSLARLESGAA